MPRFRHIQNSLRGGEISPNIAGRTDLELYPHSAEEITNYIVKSQGGASRRPGTQFVRDDAIQTNINDGTLLNGGSPQAFSDQSRVFPFIFSKTEAYAVVVARVTTETSMAIIKLSDFTEATITVEPVSVGYPKFGSYNSRDEIHEVQYAQSGDILMFVHPNHPPFYLARTATDTFVIRQFWQGPDQLTGARSFGRAFPYRTINIDSTHTMELKPFLGQVLESNKPFFDTDHVGTVFKINTGANIIYAFIDGFISTTQLSVAQPTSTNGPTTLWEEGAWSTFRGFPRSVQFFEQRIYYGGISSKPDTVFASQIGDFFELDAFGRPTDTGFGTVTASDAFSMTVASAEVNQIQWLSAGRTLVIGTLGREYIAQGGQGALSATDVSVTPATAHGSAFIQPTRIENVVAFVTRTVARVREFVFNRDEDSFVADDILKFADHMVRRTGEIFQPNFFTTGIKAIVKQEGEQNLLWVLDNEQGLFAVTRDRLSGTNAWHYHSIGGTIGARPNAQIQSIAIIPSENGSNDDLWLMVRRTINSSEKLHLERINKEFDLNDIASTSSDILSHMVYCDSAVLINSISSNIITGLGHLEGEVVVVVADGNFLGEFTVASGQIDVIDTVENAIVGLNYISQLKTSRIEDGGAFGSSQMAVKRIDEMGIRFHRTIGGKYGSEESNLEEIVFKDASLVSSEPIPLFTGDKVFKFPSSPDRNGQIIIRQENPLPQNIVAIVAKGVTYD